MKKYFCPTCGTEETNDAPLTCQQCGELMIESPEVDDNLDPKKVDKYSEEAIKEGEKPIDDLSEDLV